MIFKSFEKFVLNLEDIFKAEQIFASKPQKCQFWATWGKDWEYLKILKLPQCKSEYYLYECQQEMPSRIEFRKCKSTTECTLLHALSA